MKVLCSGLNVVDLLVSTPKDLKVGHKNECDQILMQGGAPAGNAACGMASLGHNTYFLGYVGDNPLSIVAKNELTNYNVKDDFLMYKKEASPAIAIVQIDDQGERTVLYSIKDYVPFNPVDLDEDAVKDFDLFLVDGYDTTINIHLLEIAKRHGIRTVLDMESADMDIMKTMLSLSTDPILPLECAQNLSGEKEAANCLKVISKMTNGQIVITDGSNGSYALENEIVIHQPAFKVDVVDTTGCGDSFHAAYASALLQGLDLKNRMIYGSFFASQVAQHFGGRTFFPDRTFMEVNCPLQVEH
ncbi:carbohydrate kinase family protein [Seonamhaeicola maritimus]|uniref:Carbohydrate kinase family protein n=1 Tax=Seonamhaeicola maritimus TaxID=2591822 RepID=A0A5C7GKU1_9FLAO|nr:carbohydrate kinase family protein [Seonamhaeicola maritimus]TXG38835.1 carbohydrate kinase family protein [Seonamhaeicola maritimus]